MLVRNKIDLEPDITELVVWSELGGGRNRVGVGGWWVLLGGCGGLGGNRDGGFSCRLEGDQLARELGVSMFHTSVKTDKNVGSIFQSLALAHLSRNREQVEVEQVTNMKQTFKNKIIFGCLHNR